MQWAIRYRGISAIKEARPLRTRSSFHNGPREDVAHLFRWHDRHLHYREITDPVYPDI